MLGISHLPELTGDFLKGKLPALTQRRERGSHHLGDLEYRKGKKPKKEWSSMVIALTYGVNVLPINALL